jgi:hypothetical protein
VFNSIKTHHISSTSTIMKDLPLFPDIRNNNMSNTCSLCNSTYMWPADLKRHLKTKHDQQKSTLKQQIIIISQTFVGIKKPHT